MNRPLERLSQAEKALLEWVGDGLVRPSLRSLLPQEAPRELHRLALEFFPRENLFRRLYHARKAGERRILLDLLTEDPARLALLPGLWQEARSWPKEDREALAAALVRYRAVLGQYAHPEVEEALALLAQAEDPRLRASARIKAAEAKADAGLYKEAEALLPPEEEFPLLDETARAEGLLVRAAVERWKGDYEKAARYAERAAELSVAPFLKDRVQLWRGLVAKDLGRYEEALTALAQVGHDPLLLGRARYQMGDLLMRLGSPEARARMEEGLKALEEAGAPQDEVARVRARYATLLRRLGLYPEAEAAIRRALEEALDPFTRARVESEAGILQAAQGRPLEALALLSRAEAYFRTTGERPKEARYRHLRTLFRLAAAYLLLETGTPYRPPLLGGLKAPEAKRLLWDLLAKIPEEATDRYTALRLDAESLLALLLPPRRPGKGSAPSSASPTPTSGPRPAWATPRPSSGRGLTGRPWPRRWPSPLLDPGLKAQAKATEVLALLALGEEEAAWQKLVEAKQSGLPEPFRLQLGRAVGRAHPGLAARLPPTPSPPRGLGPPPGQSRLNH